ncbi:uncharacterized protein TNIN_413781 [Trichonephila inaurata madagascariensis]|uniref:Uncharacterized protein n=1 Tax=Trichonephila inaurata madagascariensis TaxID=2747483 RepID=A0A8X6XT56_9ARAC|nr:uncharacterized protein TNIN_413781 [Trichonephila inaurata madagascariensis]
MVLQPPTFRSLPLHPLNVPYEVKNLPEAVWEIYLPADHKIMWPLAVSYLQSVSGDDALGPSSIFRKLNPFFNRNIFNNNSIIDKFVRNFKRHICSSINLPVKFVNLFKDTNSLYLHSFLREVGNLLKRDICLYRFDGEQNCRLYVFSSDRSDFPKLVIFHHAYITDDGSKETERFGFGLPLKQANSLREKVLLRTLRKADLTEGEIEEIFGIVSLERSFLINLLKSPKKDIIPKLYKMPYIPRKLAETGFETDPRYTDKNGFSAFHYCMELPETHILWMLYDFAANNFRLKDHTVRNPNSEILISLKEIGEAIEKDISKSANLSATYKKSSELILRFNKYQKEVAEGIFSRRQISPATIEQSKEIMIFILNKYKKYFYFDLPKVGYKLNLKDELAMFQDYVRHTEYYENLDAFNGSLFFDNFPHVIDIFDENNSSLFTDTLSSMFLTVLSNNFFTTQKHGIHCKNCQVVAEICEEENNALRFIPFYCRSLFLENTMSMVAELKRCSNTECRKGKGKLLQTITRSLADLPEVEDEFLIGRLKLYLNTAMWSSSHDIEPKKMVTFERTLQVIGEILQNKTASKTVVKSMLSSCILPELEHKFSQIRNHCLSHYRSNTVQGRVQIENRDHVFLGEIQDEFRELDGLFMPVYCCHVLRIEEFLIGKGIREAEKICRNIRAKLDVNLSDIADKRKILWKCQKKELGLLLSKLLKRIFVKLETKYLHFENLIDELEALLFSLNFVISLCQEDNVKILVQIAGELNKFISINKEKEITESTRNYLKGIFASNQALFEEIFDNAKDSKSFPSFSNLQSLYSEMKDYDILTNKEKRLIKRQISIYIQKSNKSMCFLTKSLHNKAVTQELSKKLKEIIMPEKKRTEINECINAICENTLLNKTLNSLLSDSKFNFKHAQYLSCHVGELDIFTSVEKTNIKETFSEFISTSYVPMTLMQLKNCPVSNIESLKTLVSDGVKKMRSQLCGTFNPQDKLKLAEQSISSSIKKAQKALKSVKEKESLNSWYKEETNKMFELELKEEHTSVLLKILLPHRLKRKLIQIVNQKVWFLIDRITLMKKILIFEDEDISCLWESQAWKKNEDVEKYMKFLMVQRYIKERQIRIPLEMLLFDCMGILKQEDLSDLWKKTNNMFIGVNMIELLAHGNPILESAGSILDPNDLPSDIVEKILKLIKDEDALKALSRLWVETKLCKLSEFKSDILDNKEKKFAFLRRRIKMCDRWESYTKLLPLKY